MTKITLNNVADLTATTTAAAVINANSAKIVTAFDNTLSRDGTVPNTLSSNIDMNGNQIVNLPIPATTTSPLRLADLNTFIGGGTITNIPSGGTTGQVLSKTSNSNYQVNWVNSVTSVGLALPADLTVTGSPVTTTGTLTAAWANTPTGAGGIVRATAPTINSPTLVTPTLGAAVGTSLNLSGLTASSSVATDGSKNLVSVANTGTGSHVLATSPTLVTPVLGAATATSINSSTVSPGHYSGEPSTGNALTGEIGEYVSSTVLSGAPVALTTATPVNVTSISLTAGDWDVAGVVCVTPANTTQMTQLVGSISTTTGTLNTTPGNLVALTTPATTYDGATQANCPMSPVRISISSTTTVFLVAMSKFTVSTNAAFGIIRARRAR